MGDLVLFIPYCVHIYQVLARFWVSELQETQQFLDDADASTEHSG